MFTLSGEKREIFGKKLILPRANGKLPIVMYGEKTKPLSYFVVASDFKKLFQKAGESSLVTFSDGQADYDVLIHDVQVHPVTGEHLHADLYVIEKGAKVRVNIPLVFEGISTAVKALGGILVKVLHEIEIEAEPKNLPHEIVVDISKLEVFEDRICIKDLVFAEGVYSTDNPEEVIALVSKPKEEKEEETEVADLTAIEVEKKGKKEEEGAEATAEAPAGKPAK